MNIDKTFDRLFAKLADDPNARNSLMAIDVPQRNISWRGVASHLNIDSQYCIASCTKLYTAALILQMADAGTIVLDAPAARYLPKSDVDRLHILAGQDRSGEMTVSQLLSNTSGLANYFEQRPRSGGKSYIEQIKLGNDFGWSHGQALDLVRTELKPKFAPGAAGKAFYSDTNFQLLDRILEEACGQSFVSLVAERITIPLSLTKTYVFTTNDKVRFHTLVPISVGTRPLHIPDAMASLGGQGGVISTLGDSLTFLKKFFEGALFDPSWLNKIQRWNHIFFPFKYGMGIMKFSMPPVFTLFRRVPPLIGHSGSTGVLMFYSPELGAFICGATNQLLSRSLPYQFMIRAMGALR